VIGGHIHRPADALTRQQRYYAQLGRCERTGDHAGAAVLRAAGPPAPELPDGITGALAYYRHRADRGDEEAARFVRRLTFSSIPPDRA
jgi:hypothetical protein